MPWFWKSLSEQGPVREDFQKNRINCGCSSRDIKENQIDDIYIYNQCLNSFYNPELQMHVHHVSARRVLKPSYLKAKAMVSRCFRVVESSRGTSRLLQRLSHLGAAHLYFLARSSQCWWEFLPQVCKMPWAAEMPWAHFRQGYNGINM